LNERKFWAGEEVTKKPASGRIEGGCFRAKRGLLPHLKEKPTTDSRKKGPPGQGTGWGQKQAKGRTLNLIKRFYCSSQFT